MRELESTTFRTLCVATEEMGAGDGIEEMGA
jgi:hypothetical protein